MGIEPAHARAICRIYAGGTGSRGTGFLVEPDLVLTASHVVKSGADEKQPYPGTHLEVNFVNAPEVQPITKDIAIIGFDPSDLDWALLRLSAPVVGIDPLRLRPIRPDFLPTWGTYGFPGDNKYGGAPYTGVVTMSTPRRLTLDLDQKVQDPFGLSGAPCVLAGRVVGILITTQDEKASERVYGIPIGPIIDACRAQKIRKDPSDPKSAVELRRDADGVPSYVSWVAQNIQGMNRLMKTAAEQLGVIEPGTVLSEADQDDLPMRVAEEMLKDLSTTVAGIDSLQTAFAKDEGLAFEIVQLAARTWIDAAAVEKLWTALVRNDLVVLNTGESEITDWFVHRAGCLNYNHPGRFKTFTPVVGNDLSPKGLRTAFEEAVAKKVRNAAAGLRARLDTYTLPIVVWISGLPDRKTALDPLRELYKEVRMIFMVGPSIPARVATEYRDATIVEPFLEAQAAARRIQARADAEEQVEDIFFAAAQANKGRR